jgi:hypothetical protein
MDGIGFMKYHIDGETADGICKDVLKETIQVLKKNIKKTMGEIKTKGGKAPAALYDDLEWDQKYLEACKVLYGYFGGR